MCTILIAWRCLDDAAFVIAANRDELVARPSALPQRLSGDPLCYGGRDLLAGGTWLAVSPDGRVAAVTNRREMSSDEVARDPARRSRGELPVRLLGAAEGAARDAFERIRPRDYNPFNIVVLSAAEALVGHGRRDAERLDIVELQPGLHVLCVHDVDAPGGIKESRIRAMLQDVQLPARAVECSEAMRRILADHTSDTPDGRDAVCIHGETYGTVSASLVVHRGGKPPGFTHAAGRPCVTPFSEVAFD